MMFVMSEGWDRMLFLLSPWSLSMLFDFFYDEHENNKAIIPKTKQNVK